MKNKMDVALFAVAFVWIVYGFCILGAVYAAGSDLPLSAWPKHDAPGCVGVFCAEVK